MPRLSKSVPARLVPLAALPIAKILEGAAAEFAGALEAVLRTQRPESAELKRIGVAVHAEVVPPKPPAADSALAVLRELVNSIQEGKPLDHLYPDLARLIAHQERRAEIVDQVLLTHEFDRAVGLASARSRLEHDLMAAAYRDELTPGERLALLEAIVPLERDARNRIKAGAIPINDLVAQLQKIDYTLAVNEDALKSKFAKTTPQGRELVRKLALRLGKAVRSIDGR